jgi:hypothetical protein
MFWCDENRIIIYNDPFPKVMVLRRDKCVQCFENASFFAAERIIGVHVVMLEERVSRRKRKAS